MYRKRLYKKVASRGLHFFCSTQRVCDHDDAPKLERPSQAAARSPPAMPPSTPRAKGDGEKEAKGDKKPAAKPKAKKPKGSAAPAVPMDAPKVMITADLDEAGAKSSLDELQKQYAALVVSFNNQQTELLSCQAQLLRAENELEVYRSAGESGGSGASVEIVLKRELEKMAAVRAHLPHPGLRRR
jgi:hypothetical protein